MKIRLNKEFTFEMAHALKDYDGECKYIHGHSFMLKVTIIGQPIDDVNSPKNGMLLDFGDLKKLINTHIINVFDHTLVLNENSSLNKSFLKNKDLDQKIISTSFQPTSENMIIYFAEIIKKILPENVHLHSLKLNETANSSAEWHAEDN